MDKIPPRQLILEAVVTCIEKYGIDKLTTRKIAETAGTNIASINYYFRSKEALVEQALSMTINHMLEDVSAAIADRQRPFLEAFEDVLFYLLEGNLRFPGITAAHLYDAVFEGKADTLGLQAMNRVYEEVAARAVQEYPGKDPQAVRFALSRILAATLFSMLSPHFFQAVDALKLEDAQDCHVLARRSMQLFASALGI
ncbi:MAG TPA: TetR/AcrR family transcriptional regulator [Anaerolineales bacterium]|nr:TetR/AcrR family transcriptional regulator [Anaerolineales bacterium]